jgi:hypothetical protein
MEPLWDNLTKHAHFLLVLRREPVEEIWKKHRGIRAIASIKVEELWPFF